MGYAVYDDRHNRNRFAGYGVPAICDHPDCDKEIDRGLAYACGEDRFSEYCGLHFCENHLSYYPVIDWSVPSDEFWVDLDEDNTEYLLMCERCAYNDPPFDHKPDVFEWLNHMLVDSSWEQWRDNNPELVDHIKTKLESLNK